MIKLSQNSIPTIDRQTFIQMLTAAFEVKAFDFIRQAAQLWLANFPGDLWIKLFYAAAQKALGHTQDARDILQKLINADPEFSEAMDLLATLPANASTFKAKQILAECHPIEHALTSHDLSGAESQIHAVLAKQPQSPLPAILHLKIMHQQKDYQTLKTLAQIYQHNFPECIQINFLLAIALINLDDQSAGIELLHWCASKDIAGQIPARLVGSDFPHRALWLSKPEILFDQAIPASVAAKLGWNHLVAGEPAPAPKPVQEISELQQIIQADFEESLPLPQTAADAQPVEPTVAEEAMPPVQPKPHAQPKADATNQPLNASDQENLRQLDEIQSEFDQLAKRIKKPALARADGRFPAYVIFSSKSALTRYYGPNTAETIDGLMKKLANNIRQLPNWDAFVYYPDDVSINASLGLNPKANTDAWNLKLSLADLDAALAKRGEMIGALLIVGGPEVVPFHNLPNPTDDSDPEVPSDNPYATIDENYFVPQWPVGRLPGGAGRDAGLLLEQLRMLNEEYAQKAGKKIINKTSFLIQIIEIINQFLRSSSTNVKSSDQMGYSASVWRIPSLHVFSTINKPQKLMLCPPYNARNLPMNEKSQHKLGYFNLHGIKDGAEWFGQSDPLSQSNDPDYPVALLPANFGKGKTSPVYIFSEACYGANINEKTIENAISLKCLDSGTKTFIGSTCIAYGSVTLPLIAADLLAHYFWSQVINGEPLGYALMRSKLNLAREMTAKQGYLDGEDQKTILSFVLYGDPLATYNPINQLPKTLIRAKAHPKVRTLSDSSSNLQVGSQTMPKEVLSQVKKAVSEYLPGLKNAEMRINQLVQNHNNGKSNAGRHKGTPQSNYVVTLKKSLLVSRHTHEQFAHMTLDAKGKVIKLSVSR